MNPYTNDKFDPNDFDRYGIHKDIDNKFDPEGFDIDSYNEYGVERNRLDKDGYNINGVDRNGLDKDGYNKNGKMMERR